MLSENSIYIFQLCGIPLPVSMVRGISGDGIELGELTPIFLKILFSYTDYWMSFYFESYIRKWMSWINKPNIIKLQDFN